MTMRIPGVTGADLELLLPSPLEPIDDDRLARHDVRLLLKRDDLIHPDLPGNKWRKLKYNLAAARQAGHRTLLTFGGAYSNHIRATAAAGRLFGFDTIGVIRGERHLPLNPVLDFAVRQGMRLAYLDRTTYRAKTDPGVIERLHHEHGDFYLLPEGGSNALAVRGCAEIPAEIGEPYDVICCPCGTGGTLAGIAAGTPPGTRAIGFAVLKGASFLVAEVARLQRQAYGHTVGDWHVDLDHHHGGYARRTPDLDRFAADFERRHGLRLDRVYVAKMMLGVFTLVADGRIPPGSTVVAVVTGVP
ncbi:pyridoxal-phosphate dependent enzyme [Thermopolyspora sp. NPDC052614]|uniref:1-aminocyclopropane-1-carboxylate deaminase/D-cysteine desulfhydrase n=1 Tax=Thermopolyspora sp. NPDC052614 TaxID=3155682 RepID=UPI00342F81A2